MHRPQSLPTLAHLLDDVVMAYLKPRAIESKFFNPLAMRSTLWDVHTLEVARRNAGEPQRVPVIPLEQDGSLFIVSTRGEADWVKNVRAAASVQLGQKGKFVEYAATEVPADQRSGIITAYRKKAGREVDRYWKKLPQDEDHPTFQLTPS
jgi:deazaflavin-dependent oxidoreductase (nitroreductase family)